MKGLGSWYRSHKAWHVFHVCRNSAFFCLTVVHHLALFGAYLDQPAKLLGGLSLCKILLKLMQCFLQYEGFIILHFCRKMLFMPKVIVPEILVRKALLIVKLKNTSLEPLILKLPQNCDCKFDQMLNFGGSCTTHNLPNSSLIGIYCQPCMQKP